MSRNQKCITLTGWVGIPVSRLVMYRRFSTFYTDRQRTLRNGCKMKEAQKWKVNFGQNGDRLKCSTQIKGNNYSIIISFKQLNKKWVFMLYQIILVLYINSYKSITKKFSSCTQVVNLREKTWLEFKFLRPTGLQYYI